METEKILTLENDGLNLAADEDSLYVRCKRRMLKYNLPDMSLAAENTVFKKDGKARCFTLGKQHIFLLDFCDFYALNKNDLRTEEFMHIGSDLSSDLVTVEADASQAYIAVRNGGIAAYEPSNRILTTASVCGASSWSLCAADGHIYMGLTTGELAEIDAQSLTVTKQRRFFAKNIYSVVYDRGLLYAISQDMSLKIIDAAELELINERKKAAKGMTRILGVYGDKVVVADGGIAVFDAQTLELRERFAFPTGHFNKGACLYGSKLYGSDYESIYCREL